MEERMSSSMIGVKCDRREAQLPSVHKERRKTDQGPYPTNFIQSDKDALADMLQNDALSSRRCSTYRSIRMDYKIQLSTAQLEPPEEQRRRFEIECEFVQALANPHYVNFLAQRGFLKEQHFINYLKYLLYWKQPEYARFCRFLEKFIFLH
ncbi:hypothetical protein Y032_0576g217 [Ancylostoma ceylanicum]|uniref:Mediator of RNA polymerase II transcription subunit 31 n=1 Tax=Ancylostoma ceylanicum TaxID=53326 RepID=A0A016WNR2_9BILA|nr:hypothetical protein Y032_0576g217 [Ancylostoma ceylanicum]